MLPLKFRSAAKRRFWWLMPALHAVRAGRANPVHIWREDRAFREVMEQVEPRTLVDWPACFILYRTVRLCARLGGVMAEIGVFRGGTARLLSRAAPEKTLHLFDTFGGMPPSDPRRDLHQEKDFADTSLDEVRSYLADCDNAVFHRGVFPETGVSVASELFCFVHVDADIYQSVWDACAFFYPRLVSGGAMVLDDYGFVTCPGAREAVDRFFGEHGVSPIYLPTGQALIWKS